MEQSESVGHRSRAPEERVRTHARAVPGEAFNGQRVAALIDVQNMFYSAKSLFQSKINYRRLLEEVAGKRQLIRAVAYVVQRPDVDQTSFIDVLTRLGYEVRVKILKVRPDGSARGDWDTGLTIDAIRLAEKVDTVVLVSGDGDFVDLAAYLAGRGVRVEVMGFLRNTANELVEAAHAFIPIEEHLLFKEKKFVEQAERAATGEGLRPAVTRSAVAASREQPGFEPGFWNDMEDGEGEAKAESAKTES